MPSSPTVLDSRHCGTVDDLADTDLPSLGQALATMTDPRARRGIRYQFTDLLLVLAAAVISGSKTLTEITEWATDTHARGILTVFKRAPSLTTIHRIVTLTDAKAFDAAINGWLIARTGHQGADTTGLSVVAVDGKEIRGAKNAGQPRVFLMAGLDQATGTVLGQEAIGAKTNEIPHLTPCSTRSAICTTR